jgi:hypothetical protein
MSLAKHKALVRFATAEFGTVRGEAAQFLADYLEGQAGLGARHDALLARHGERWLQVLDDVASAHSLRTATMHFD